MFSILPVAAATIAAKKIFNSDNRKPATKDTLTSEKAPDADVPMLKSRRKQIFNNKSQLDKKANTFHHYNQPVPGTTGKGIKNQKFISKNVGGNIEYDGGAGSINVNSEKNAYRSSTGGIRLRRDDSEDPDSVRNIMQRALTTLDEHMTSVKIKNLSPKDQQAFLEYKQKLIKAINSNDPQDFIEIKKGVDNIVQGGEDSWLKKPLEFLLGPSPPVYLFAKALGIHNLPNFYDLLEGQSEPSNDSLILAEAALNDQMTKYMGEYSKKFKKRKNTVEDGMQAKLAKLYK